MFIGREKELRNLNSLYDTDKFQFPIAKTGFTKGCIDKSKELGNVHLVTFDEMMK